MIPAGGRRRCTVVAASPLGNLRWSKDVFAANAARVEGVLRIDLGDGREDGSVLRGAADWQRQQGCVRRGIYALLQYIRKGFFFLASILYIEVL